MHGRAFFVSSHLAARTSRMARLRPRGARLAPSLSTLGRLAGETLASTLAAQTVLRVRQGRPLTRPMYLSGLRPLHLCGTRLEGGHQGLSRRYGSVEGEPLALPASAPAAAGTPGRCGRGGWYVVAGTRLPRTFLAPVSACRHACVPADDAAARFGSTHANLKVRE